MLYGESTIGDPGNRAQGPVTFASSNSMTPYLYRQKACFNSMHTTNGGCSIRFIFEYLVKLVGSASEQVSAYI